MPRTAPFWRPLSPCVAPISSLDTSSLRYVELPFPHLVEHLAPDDISWTQPDDGMSGNPLLHCIVAKKSHDVDGSSAASFASTATSPISLAPSDASFTYARRDSAKNANLGLQKGDADIIGNPRASVYTDAALSFIEVEEAYTASFTEQIADAKPPQYKVKYLKPRGLRPIPPPPPRQVDIAYFMNKALPCLPRDSVNTTPQIFDLGDDSVVDPAIMTSVKITKPPSIASCPSSFLSSDSGSSKSLSAEIGCVTTALLLSRQPASPLFIHQSKPPLLPAKDVPPQPIRILLEQPPKNTHATTNRKTKSLFKRRRE